VTRNWKPAEDSAGGGFGRRPALDKDNTTTQLRDEDQGGRSDTEIWSARGPASEVRSLSSRADYIELMSSKIRVPFPREAGAEAAERRLVTVDG